MSLSRTLKTSSFRLAALFAAVTAVAFIILLAVIYWIATEALSQQVRDGVSAEFASLTGQSRGADSRALAEEIAARASAGRGSHYFYYLQDGQGRRLAGNYQLTSIFDGWRQEPFDRLTEKQMPGWEEDEDDHQLVGFGAYLPQGAFLFVGDNGIRVIEAQEAIIEAFSWTFGLALALSGLAGMLASRGFLRRIDAINSTSRAIMAGRLRERIPVSGRGDEIDQLAGNLNRMLDGNQALMDSLKQVSSSIAHDLRTPLTRLRQGLEEAGAQAMTPDAFKRAVERAIADSDNILATFSALLRISQIESGSRRAGLRPLSLSAIFQRIVETYGAIAEDERRSFVFDVMPGIDYLGDEELLVQMAANLVENALGHTPPGTAITVTLKTAGGRLIAEIADHGGGIPEAERQRVFERFYRLDRSRSSGGHGLGLALVAAIADLHGIAIDLADNAPGLRVTLDFGPAPLKGAAAEPATIRLPALGEGPAPATR